MAAGPARASASSLVERADAALRWVNVSGAALSGLLILLMIAIVVYDVVLRYAFNAPTIWAFDVSRFLLAYVAFLGLSLALQDGTHVSVDLFLEFAGARVAWWLQLVAHVLVVAFGIVFTWQLTNHTLEAFTLNWLSPTMLAVPLKYVYAIGPIGAALFTLTALQLLLRHLVEPVAQAPVGRLREVEADDFA